MGPLIAWSTQLPFGKLLDIWKRQRASLLDPERHSAATMDSTSYAEPSGALAYVEVTMQTKTKLFQTNLIFKTIVSCMLDCTSNHDKMWPCPLG